MPDRRATAGAWDRFSTVTALTERRGIAAMTDGAQISWISLGDKPNAARTPPVVMLHGGPGLPDYLADVAPMVADLAPVHRYDQRGTGESRWQGPHSLARHVEDLAELLDAWGAPEGVLIGHSYGTDLATRFCLAHPTGWPRSCCCAGRSSATGVPGIRRSATGA